MTRRATATAIGRREVLKTSATAIASGVGLLSATGAASASSHGTDSRPTLTASSPECETLHLQRNDRGPTAEISVDGPDSFTTSLGRGESETVDVTPGTYEISAEPRGVVVEDSTVEVDECLPPGVDAWLDCSTYRALHFYNPLDIAVYIQWIRTEPDGRVTSRGRSLVEPGETSDWPVTVLDHDTVPVYYYEYWVSEDWYGEGPLRPINGSLDPLILTEPCEELDLPTSPP